MNDKAKADDNIEKNDEIAAPVERLVMRGYRVTLKFIELSRWFNRKSQHYILGNWLEYTDNWDYENGRFDWKRLKYQIGYPKAWCKFMWYSRHDILGA